MNDRSVRNVDASKLTVIDLFAGCGGLTLGFHNAGFKTIAAVEHNAFAAATYRANFPDVHLFQCDIQAWRHDSIPDADVIIGGPPCQGFSNLNRKSKQRPDDRNELWSTYVDVVAKVRPKAFLLENVDRFWMSSELQQLLQETDFGGRLTDYVIESAVVKATDFGAAQLRKRTIVIGTRRDHPAIEIPEGNDKPPRTVREVIGAIEQRIPRYRTELPGAGPYRTDQLHLTRRYEPLSIRRFRAIPKGGNRFDLPDDLKAPCWLKHRTGAGDVMGRLHWDKPSVTIRTEFFKPEKGRYLHPTEDRALTHREAALLQGFPDAFLWYGSKVEIARQIGNAVPVELAQGLAAHVADGLLSRRKAAGRGKAAKQLQLFADADVRYTIARRKARDAKMMTRS
jgi:DNA (cytosine-5)-methyltransferase 1